MVFRRLQGRLFARRLGYDELRAVNPAVGLFMPLRGNRRRRAVITISEIRYRLTGALISRRWGVYWGVRVFADDADVGFL